MILFKNNNAGSPACAGRSNGRTKMWKVYIIKSGNKRKRREAMKSF